MGDKKPPPTWETPSFWGLLCDPFAQGTVMEGGEVLHGVYGIARCLQTIILKDDESKAKYLPGFNTQDLTCCQSLMPILKDCFEICRSASEMQEPAQLNNLALEVQTKIRALSVGGILLIPGGWNDNFSHRSKVVFIVMKTGQTDQGAEYSFVVCNSGQGKRYHLATCQRRTTAYKQPAIGNKYVHVSKCVILVTTRTRHVYIR